MALPTGTVTFLFTDIEGSTQLWEQHPEVMNTALAKHDSILRESIESNHGHVIKTTGDGFHAAFETAHDALNAVIQAQLDLHQVSEVLIRVRMGLHTAEAELRDGDYYGASLNRAARIMSIGHGGQVLLSETISQILREQLPKDTALLELGEHHLRGMVRPEKICQLVIPNLPKDFPPLNSIPAIISNLSIQFTSFIGREKEISEIKAALNTSRLVTLIGSGGTGKTRLTIEVGKQEIPSFTNGVWLVELAPLSDAAQIIPAIAQIFGLQSSSFSSLAALVSDYLHDKKLLLILDNCEHLIAACAHIAEELLQQCLGLQILASSREALGIPGEVVYHTPSLADPESTRLFVERAQAANPKFSLNDTNASSIAQICSRLDGIPLAIELAAARIKLLSVDEIAARLDDRFKLLTGGSRTALPRQQTLRALIDWSHDMLSMEERALLWRLSVFAGGWTFEAAEYVCPDHNVLDILAQLVNKSLVVVDDSDSETTRYHLLETIRQYAREKLLDAGEALAARDIHARYFLQMAETSEPELYKGGSWRLVVQLEKERDNFRAALEWAIEKNVEIALRIIYSLQLFWIKNGNQADGRILAETAIDSAEKTMPQGEEAVSKRKFFIARALSTLIAVAISQGDNRYVGEVAAKCESYARAIGNKGLVARALSLSCAGRLSTGDTENVDAWSREALECAHESDDVFSLGLSLGIRGEYLMITGQDLQTARQYIDQSTNLLKEQGLHWGYALIVLGVGMVAKYKGDFEYARSKLKIILPLFQEMGDIQRVVMVKSEFGHMERYEGNLDKAEQAYRETLPLWQKLRHYAAVANQLECLAFIALEHEQDELATKLLGAAEALREKINISMSPFERLEYNEKMDSLQNGMDEDLFTALWAEGRAMTMEQAIQLALAKSKNQENLGEPKTDS